MAEATAAIAYRFVKKTGPKYEFIGIGTDNEGEIVVTFNPSSLHQPIDGYNPPVPQAASATQAADGSISVTPVADVVKKNQRFPFDRRLKNIISTDGSGGQEHILRRPFHSDDMSTGTGGLFKPEEQISETTAAQSNTKGVPAISNRFAIVTLKGAYTDKTDGMTSLIDTPGKRRWYEDYNFGSTDNPKLTEVGYSKDVTVSKLIAMGIANKRGTTPYNYSDFAYCKYFNKIPNNYLITLRRYAVPTFDSLDFPFVKDDMKFLTKTETITEKDANGKTTTKKVSSKYIDPEALKSMQDKEPEPDENMKAPPVAQAVTWLGDSTGNSINSLTAFTVGLTWEDMQAVVWDNTQNASDIEGNSGMPGWMQGFAKSLAIGSGETGVGGSLSTQVPPDPYEEGPYANRIQGPVNRIDSVKRRKAPLTFEQQGLTLKFHYVARSIGGINTKAAMLDIIANFLILTYGTGGFWGGANRYRGGAPSYPWKRGMAAWYSGSPSKFADAIADSVSAIGDRLSSMFDNILKDPIGTLKSIAGSGLGAAMAYKIKGKAPLLAGMRALLTGEPTGPWHLIVGNPFNPIMMIGNLICESCNFKFSDELGPDDFPTEMTVEVKLGHAMARDRYGVESMFNKGSGRIYTIPDDWEKGWAGNKESKVDKNTGDKNPYINKVMGVDKNNLTNSKNISKNTDFDAIISTGTKSWNSQLDQGTKIAQKVEMGYHKKGEQ